MKLNRRNFLAMAGFVAVAGIVGASAKGSSPMVAYGSTANALNTLMRACPRNPLSVDLTFALSCGGEAVATNQHGVWGGVPNPVRRAKCANLPPAIVSASTLTSAASVAFE